MAGNPLIAQGSLNRLKASIVWPSFPSLNVTPPFLNREGIRLALEGEAVAYLRTMTGAVTSPEPYVMASVTINLLKTQGLSALYLAQLQADARLGDCVVRPDVQSTPTAGLPSTSGVLPPFDFTNMAIESVRELALSGEDAGFAIVCRGYYLVNQSLWN